MNQNNEQPWEFWLSCVVFSSEPDNSAGYVHLKPKSKDLICVQSCWLSKYIAAATYIKSSFDLKKKLRAYYNPCCTDDHNGIKEFK